MTYSDAYNIRTTSVKFNDIADAIDGVVTRQYGSLTTGTSSAYIANPSPAWESYDASAIIIIIPHVTNAASATIQISPATNGVAAKELRIGGTAIGAGILQAGIPTVLAYTGSYFEVLLQNVTIPTGQVTAFAGSTAPGGWLLCDGTDYASIDYPSLHGVIGTTYNIGGEAAGRFRVPDLGRRIPMGKGSSDTLGNTEGGNKAGTAYASRSTSHSHTMAHSHTVPNHQHTVLAHKHSTTATGLGVDIAHTHQTTDITGSVGGSDGTHDHELRQEQGGGGTAVTSAANIISLVGSTVPAYRNGNNHYTGGGHGHSFSLTASLGTTTKYAVGTIGPVAGTNGDVDTLTKTGEGGTTLTSDTSVVSGTTTPPFLFINYIIKT